MTRKATASSAAKSAPAIPAGKPTKSAKPATTKVAAKASTRTAAKAPAGEAGVASPKHAPKAARPPKKVIAKPASSDARAAAHMPSEEELALASLYADDMQSPVAAHGEFRDARTADEDREMSPEHTAKAVRRAAHGDARQDRRDHWKRLREERKSRRESRSKSDSGTAPVAGAAPTSPAASHPSNARRSHVERAGAPRSQGLVSAKPASLAPKAGDGDRALASAAQAVFASMATAQSIPVRQLTHMMKKRELFAADPERVVQDLKWQLITDERERKAAGFRSVVSYRGRDLFATGAARLSATADSEAALYAAWRDHGAAVREALQRHVASLAAPAFERLVHALLEAQHYTSIAWVKRAAPYSYATALDTSGGTVLISVRAGDGAIDRRGVGELRVGTEAKDLPTGLLFSAGTLSDDAQAELLKPGRSVALCVGDALVQALIAAGVGVAVSHAPISYLDEAFIAELSAG
ncbi:MAG: restriction endonuclease [Myxococcales bacterium]|nr:restriction endonuclease [Myxococcales bacterium]